MLQQICFKVPLTLVIFGQNFAMTIVSYNVNGIRAALNKGFIDWLQTVNPDVVCLQETKAMKEQVDVSLFEAAGYTHHYWFSAEKKGYSGVALLCKKEPDHEHHQQGNAHCSVTISYGSFNGGTKYIPATN